MGESPQNLYAKNLQQSFGYPLRFPEPKPGLPSSYSEQGLHIGDVGYIDDVGMFEVLFNICFSSDHELHSIRKDLASLVGLTKFNPNEAPPIPNAFPSGRVICYGIQGSHGDNLKDTQSAPCKFMSCSTSGAILILPSGAVRHSLNKNKEEEFRKLAEKRALDWCKFADCKSLYLITGSYKTSSWYLASFHDTNPTGQILLERNDAGRYNWDSRCDYRQSPRENRNENQTVLISGFKIEVRGWDQHTVVEKLAPHSGSIWSELTSLASFLLGILIFLWQRIAPRSEFKLWDHGALKDMDGVARVDRVPALSQPFHPSDVINRYLLDKNPNVQVAVTHDSQWLSMLEKNELPHEDIAEEGRFRAFLEEKYTCDSDSDNVVYLRRKTEDSNDSRWPALSPKTFSFPTRSDDSQQIVITRMRVENVVTGLRRIPVGFYVLVQFDSTRRRTKTKSVLLHDSIIEWDDEIMLPRDSSVMVRLSINASFEFEPTLGNGETLCVSEISVGGLAQAGSTYLPFSSGTGKDAPCPSLLITLEEQRFDHLADWSHGDSNLGCKDPSYIRFAEVTDEGHDALLCYHKDHGTGDLEKSVEHFELALSICPSDHECRAAALFNLATARFINCQVHGTISELDAAIASYRNALALRPAPFPDRPGTLLHLAQALLYRYGRLRCEGSVANEIEGLVTEVKQISCSGSYDRRAADLVLQTFKRYQVLTFGKLAELDELISELDRSARMPPDWYFDRPHRLINFSAALHKRFEITGDLDNLEKSISIIEEVERLTSDGHFDKPWILATLGDALRIRFVQRGNVVDLDKSISMNEEAVRLTPDGHPDRPSHLNNLVNSFLTRFKHLGDLNDLEQAILRNKDAVELTPVGHPDRPIILKNLVSLLLKEVSDDPQHLHSSHDYSNML
ncbi:hypothetical protein HYDPIDRAFT_151374 [Hydnomerulius pinastri MD-312]|nr:hypothetical protein HYDPIDRAFT_151374 [Hydnomerulius pinastri MD-312]